MENERKTVKIDQKKMLLSIGIGVGVAIIMVTIFGKLAPIAIVSYRLVTQIIKPLFG